MKRINKWLVKLLQALLSVLERKEMVSTPKTLQEDRTPLNSHIEDKVGIDLLIIRDMFTDESTIGELFLNSSYKTVAFVNAIVV